MNRHERRAAGARGREAARGMTDSEADEGIWWEQEPDPVDPRFALIRMRIPTRDMPKARYTGSEAGNRLCRHAVGVLQGMKAVMEEERPDAPPVSEPS